MKRWMVMGGFFLLMTPNLWAALEARKYTYQSGGTVDPVEVNTNEQTVYDYLRTGVDTYLDGSITPADLSGSPVDDTVFVADSASAATWRTVPNCTDTGGNHLNYTQSTNALSCGTTSSASVDPVSDATPNITLEDTTAGEDDFGWHADASIMFLNNETDSVRYWEAGQGHEIRYGFATVPFHAFFTDGVGNDEMLLPNGSIGTGELADNAVTDAKLAPGFLKSTVVNFTLLESASIGGQTITGVGFRGRALSVMCSNGINITWSYGTVDSTGTQTVHFNNNAGVPNRDTAKLTYWRVDGAQEFFSVFQSWTADGFTIERTLRGNTNDELCTALVFGD